MVGEKFRLFVRVKTCVGGKIWCQDIRPGMVLLALNTTMVDRDVMNTVDKRGANTISLSKVIGLTKQRPLHAVFLDPGT
jgi:hypothetical protein